MDTPALRTPLGISQTGHRFHARRGSDLGWASTFMRIVATVWSFANAVPQAGEETDPCGAGQE
ncbi:hypothetical protein GCM10009828_099860 [Actinoplanes couchii]|uniref:Uncharacterized protein n=1 Tax=Actinoplanes couchii TaxID=403638 RepID=A0ABQ3XMB1_9ACTN|nr:hypothetical protein Aco03nite_080040 [Actinoplanes couchii]